MTTEPGEITDIAKGSYICEHCGGVHENGWECSINILNKSRQDTRAFMKEPDKVQRILATRGGRYGDYRNNAEVTQKIMLVLSTGLTWSKINHMHREGLHMIAHKMARIVNGDANWHDSWDDIAGYAKLVSDRIPGEKKKDE